MSGPWVFVGTKDYATGLMDAASLAFAASSFDTSAFANSVDVSSFYALKTSIPSVSGFANSLDVSSFYATKAMVVGSGYMSSSSLSALMSGDAGFTSVGTLTIKGSQGMTAATGILGALSGSGGAYNLTVQGESGASYTVLRSSTNANAPALIFNKSRGTLGAPSAVAMNDNLGSFTFFGYGASAFQAGAQFRAVALEATPSDTAMGTQWQWRTATVGTVSLVTQMTLDTVSGLVLSTNIGYSKQRVTAFANGASLTINNNTDVVVFTVSATRTTGTIIMPAAPVDGQIVTFAFGSLVITTLTLQGNTGQTIDGALSTAAANSFASYVWDATSSTWYRCG